MADLPAGIATWNRLDVDGLIVPGPCILYTLIGESDGTAGVMFQLFVGRDTNGRLFTQGRLPVNQSLIWTFGPGVFIDGPLFLNLQANGVALTLIYLLLSS